MSEHIGLLEEVRNMYPELDVYEKGTVAALKRDYNELIMAVANKHEGETRHQTALRYILEAEQGSSEASVVPSRE